MEVSILRNLPSTLFQGVCVHEFTHAWLSIHEILELPQWASEGLSELMCHRVFVAMPSIESREYARRIEMKRDPIYGAGFAKVRDIVDRYGSGTVIGVLLRKGSLPE